MSTSSMLHARNNVSPARYRRVTYLALAEVCQAGHRTNRMHAGSAVFKTQSEAVVLLPGKQHEWKEAQEVRNGSFSEVDPHRRGLLCSHKRTSSVRPLRSEKCQDATLANDA